MNRIKQIATLINNCQCMYDVGSDHALLAIDLLKNKKVKCVVNIEKNWQPHNAGKANLAKNHLTTKTINVLNDGLIDICKKVFIQPQYIVIAGMGAQSIISIIENKDSSLNKNIKYIFGANTDIEVLRKYLAKNKWNINFETVCEDRNKFYQIICATQDNKVRKINTFEAYFGKESNQKDIKLWIKYLKTIKTKIEKKKLNKVSPIYSSLYKSIKATLDEN